MKDSAESVGGAMLSDHANALGSTFREMYAICWHCENGHKFGNGQVRTPSGCPVCKSPMVDSIITRQKGDARPIKQKFELSALENEALARIS